MGFLDGVKVVDFTHAYAGPFCSLFLADYGAEVIKIERVDGGDQARTWGPFKNDYSAYYASFNRGKKSITLDIKSKEGQKIIYDLIKDADIVCSNFKAGTLEKYGVGYEQMKQVKLDIIYATISGFGTKGELSKYPAYDNVIQAMSGIMDVNGFADKGPTKIGPAIGDSYTGLLLLLGLMIAFHHRQKTGKGQQIDVTMLGALFGLLEYPVLEYANNGKVISRSGNASHYVAPSDVYQTKDDYIAITVKNDSQWKTFCNILGLPDTEEYETNVQRLDKQAELKTLIEAKLKDYTSKEAEALFDGSSIATSSVMGIAESLENPQLLARDMVIEVEDPVMGPVKLVGNPIHLSENKPVTNIPSPTLGEHTDAILQQLGYTEEKISALKEAKVI